MDSIRQIIIINKIEPSFHSNETLNFLEILQNFTFTVSFGTPHRNRWFWNTEVATTTFQKNCYK